MALDREKYSGNFGKTFMKQPEGEKRENDEMMIEMKAHTCCGRTRGTHTHMREQL